VEFEVAIAGWFEDVGDRGVAAALVAEARGVPSMTADTDVEEAIEGAAVAYGTGRR